jgi:hypothetical protein
MLVTVLAIVFLVGCSIPTTTPRPLEITQAATAPISPTAMTTISPTVTATTSPTATAQQIMDEGDRTGVVELDRIIQMVLDGDMIALRSIVHYTQAGCTFEDGLGGPPKCKEGEVEGETIEVLPFFGPEGHFIRKENIDLWILINPLDLYAVYTVSDSAFTNPIYPSDQYAIAFVNEARFMIITLQIVEGHIVRVDTALGNPPMIRADDVDTYLIQPMELDQ